MKSSHAALESLMPVVYDELRRLARRHLRRERPDHTLQTTALVNEVYLRLVEQRNLRVDDRVHFMGMAARLMRFVLVDYARRRNYDKRGGLVEHVPLDAGVQVDEQQLSSLLDLHAALEKLAALDPRKTRVAELRLFAGLTVAETAAVLDVAPVTVMRDWRLARHWLERELRPPAV